MLTTEDSTWSQNVKEVKKALVTIDKQVKKELKKNATQSCDATIDNRIRICKKYDPAVPKRKTEYCLKGEFQGKSLSDATRAWMFNTDSENSFVGNAYTKFWKKQDDLLAKYFKTEEQTAFIKAQVSKVSKQLEYWNTKKKSREDTRRNL